MKRWLIPIISILIALPIISVADSNQVSLDEITSATTHDNEFDLTSPEAPRLNVGDEWTYQVQYQERLNDNILFDFNIDDLRLIITEERMDDYKGHLSGNITGEMDSISYPVYFEDASFKGDFLCGKSSLGISQWTMNIKTSRRIGPVTIPIDLILSITADPSFRYFNFPLFLEKQWVIPECTIEINVIAKINSQSEYTILSETINSDPIPLTCTSEQRITVDAGTYPTFEITDNHGYHHCYFSEEVKNIIKFEVNNPLKEKIIDMELLSFNTQQQEGPQRPDQPIGPVEGKTDEAYTYCVHHADPEYESLLFLFDWDDGSDSGWLGPYGIEDEICSTHTWQENGTYQVRVKAKNELDQESPWSDPTSVQIGDIGDITPPSVQITKPSNSMVYLNDARIGSFPFIIVAGFITVEVEAFDDESGVEKVEFLVNQVKKGVDESEPYTYLFDESPGRYTITAKAFDNAGNTNSDSVTVLCFF